MRLPFTRPPRFAPSAASHPARLATMIFSWQSLGVVLVAVMLARWVWVFAAPVEVAMPATTSWKKSDAAAELFGHAVEVDAGAVAAASNYKLIGVFAHPTAGFAVLLVDGKQVGVGLGGEVSPGMRLVETDAAYVLLERGGVRQRVDLAVSAASTGITSAPSNNANTANTPMLVMPQGAAQSTPQTAPADSGIEAIPPEQRVLMQQELDNFRRRR